MSRGGRLVWRGVIAAAALVACVCAVTVCVSTVRLVWQGWLPVPYSDQWQQLVVEHDLGFTWLASLHNEHRLLVPRLIFVLDRWVSQERNVVDLAANVLMQVFFVWGLADLLRRERRPSAATSALLVGSAISLAFWAVQWENFTWGFQVQIFGVVLGTTIVLRRVAFGGRSWPSLLGTVVAMVVTGLTLSTGFVAAVLAVPLSWWLGRPRRDLALFALVAVALTGIAVGSLGRSGADAGTHTGALRDLPAMALYAVVALGGPIGEGLENLLPLNGVAASFCAGLAGLALFASLLPSALSRPRSCRAAMLTAFAASGCLTVAATALARWSLGPTQAMSSRYATPVLAFWIALCFLLHLGAGRMGRVRACVAVVLPAGLAVLALASQSAFVDAARQIVDARAEAIPALAIGMADPVAIRDSVIVGPDPLAHVASLKAARASLFAEPWLDWFGQPLAAHAPLSDPSRCAGGVGERESIGTGLHGGSRMYGRVRIAGTARLLRLVLTDESGMVVGYGVAPPFEDLSNTGGVRSWTGAAATQPETALIAYALLRDGTACRLTRPADPSITTASLAALPAERLSPGGALDRVVRGDALLLEGWAMVGSQPDRAGTLYVDTDLPVAKLSVRPERRPDVAVALRDPRLATSGFALTITLKPHVARPATMHLCVWTNDPGFGPRLLTEDTDPGLCRPQG